MIEFHSHAPRSLLVATGMIEWWAKAVRRIRKAEPAQRFPPNVLNITRCITAGIRRNLLRRFRPTRETVLSEIPDIAAGAFPMVARCCSLHAARHAELSTLSVAWRHLVLHCESVGTPRQRFIDPRNRTPPSLRRARTCAATIRDRRMGSAARAYALEMAIVRGRHRLPDALASHQNGLQGRRVGFMPTDMALHNECKRIFAMFSS